MTKRVGNLTPIPTDANIAEYLTRVQESDDKELYEILVDMRNTIEETEEAGQPAIFAYGKLQEFLASPRYMTEPLRIKLLAAAIWELTHND
jgi:hypothetical protein